VQVLFIYCWTELGEKDDLLIAATCECARVCALSLLVSGRRCLTLTPDIRSCRYKAPDLAVVVSRAALPSLRRTADTNPDNALSWQPRDTL